MPSGSTITSHVLASSTAAPSAPPWPTRTDGTASAEGSSCMYQPSPDRYDSMTYNRCGRSGLMLPALSLGLWHNFGNDKPPEVADALCRTAFDHGITHFDLANNYGPPPGEAEITFGKILKTTFSGLRDEMVISTKAGFRMWPGPYGE